MSETSTVANRLVRIIKDELYPGREVIGLHEPTFTGNEKAYVLDAIDSTFVSSVGKYVDRFEEMVAEYTGATKAVAAMNGTAALHATLHLMGVGRDDLVITQPLTFVATANAIKYCGADPVFVDVDEETLGLSPQAVRQFLEDDCEIDDGRGVLHTASGRRVAACVPMHTFGLPLRITELVELCDQWSIPVIEDAAESLGSFVGKTHTGRFGKIGILSFNGNKTITTGGGGMIITDDDALGRRTKHITTTAKVPHTWEYVHDELGFNYRLPNLNAALGCAQMEQLDNKIAAKAKIARSYREALADTDPGSGLYQMVEARPGTRPNYWLNAIRCPDRNARDAMLTAFNEERIMARPIWELMYRLPAFSSAITTPCPIAEKLVDTVVNLPSWPVAVSAR
ncbi:MAG: LegC family aminotransferase [Spirochaeta sp.]|jgi:aminotransferase in exopolysaccharide biosynthesis|nr:LegC family aminotransferase [Spirochaeta sp.]